jgi:DnaJ like chaperone protein
MQPESFKIPANWWGKIIGGVLGLLKGGLYGAMAGLFVGHMADRFIEGFRNRNQTRDLFFQALFGALGQVNKADGRVTQVEIDSAENLMRRLELNDDERRAAISCFNAGKSSDFDLKAAMQDFTRFTAMRHDLRQMFLELLIEGAAVDGSINQAEEAVLFRVSRILHIPAQLLTAMLNAGRAHAGGYQYHGGGQGAGATVQRPPLSRAFATLGLDDTASNAEIKRAYRKLVGQYHPDRLVSRGLPDEMMEKAKHRVREINTAYDQLKQARNIK